VPVGTAPGARARHEIDDGRRGRGAVFGACRPATGEAFTVPSAGRTTATWVDFLDQVDVWLPADADPVSAIVDTLSPHSAPDVRLFSLAHPRGEFVFEPTDAADLTLIEPWWKVVRSRALTGRRCATWDEGCQAVATATRSWNAQRHPVVWGTRRRHRPPRRPDVGLMPKAP
jgi:hypothetical protein